MVLFYYTQFFHPKINSSAGGCNPLRADDYIGLLRKNLSYLHHNTYQALLPLSRFPCCQRHQASFIQTFSQPSLAAVIAGIRELLERNGPVPQTVMSY